MRCTYYTSIHEYTRNLHPYSWPSQHRSWHFGRDFILLYYYIGIVSSYNYYCIGSNDNAVKLLCDRVQYVFIFTSNAYGQYIYTYTYRYTQLRWVKSVFHDVSYTRYYSLLYYYVNESRDVIKTARIFFFIFHFLNNTRSRSFVGVVVQTSLRSTLTHTSRIGIYIRSRLIYFFFMQYIRTSFRDW